MGLSFLYADLTGPAHAYATGGLAGIRQGDRNSLLVGTLGSKLRRRRCVGRAAVKFSYVLTDDRF
jgi:hypothetical protein